MSAKKWSQLMDSMYEEDPWWETDKQHPRINPSHFDPNSAGSGSGSGAGGGGGSETKASKLVRTLSTKFAKQAVAKETTGRRQLSRAALAPLERTLSSLERQEAAESLLFDPRVWSEAFATSRGVLRAQLRLLVQDTTRLAARDEHYWLVAGQNEAVPPRKVALPVHQRTLENVARFDFADDPAPGSALRESRYAGTAHFVYADVVDVGVFMKQEQKCDPLVLMFAHPTVLGGTQSGGISQEDYILRRTNVGNLVNNESNKAIRRDWEYELPKYGGIYVPSALVIRSNEATGYKFLQNPIRLSFVLAAAPLNEQTFVENKDAAFLADWRKRIDSIFAIGLQKGHDVLVLGAWGCGEMGNNCAQVATLFKEAATTRFRGCFKHIVFSFLHDPEAFKAFGEVFGSPKLPIPHEVDLFDRKKRMGRKSIVVECPSVKKKDVNKEKDLAKDKQELEDQDLEEALDWRETEIAW